MADSTTWVWINRGCLIVGTGAAICCAVFAYDALPQSPPATKIGPSVWDYIVTPLHLAMGFGILAIGLLAVGSIGLWRHRHPKVIHTSSATVQLRGVSAEAIARGIVPQTAPEPTEFSKFVRGKEADWLRKGQPKTK